MKSVKHDLEVVDGMTHCRRCGGVDKELPTDCPTHIMYPNQMDRVYTGRLDFKDGRWQPVGTKQQTQPTGKPKRIIVVRKGR